ncbi:MAG: hypothetical protein PVI01_10895 [Gemmatimonadales bacterium]
MTEQPVTTDGSSLQRGMSSVWERIAPLGVGAVASSAVVIAASAVLRRTLGPRARVLGWVGTLVMLPLGFWALSRKEEGPTSDDGPTEAELPPPPDEPQSDTNELENP